MHLLGNYNTLLFNTEIAYTAEKNVYKYIPGVYNIGDRMPSFEFRLSDFESGLNNKKNSCLVLIGIHSRHHPKFESN